MKPFPPIENDDEHAAALVKFDELMEAPEKDHALIAQLAFNIETYEKKRWLIAEPGDSEREKWRCENVRGYETATSAYIVLGMLAGHVSQIDLGENKTNNHHLRLVKSFVLAAEMHMGELIRRLQAGETE